MKNGTQIYPVKVPIKEIVLHPEFNASSRKNDIAVVFKKNPVTLSSMHIINNNVTFNDFFFLILKFILLTW